MIINSDDIVSVLGKERVLRNEPMSRHTTFHLGGPADYYYEASTIEELVAAVKYCREQSLPYFILGFGSNLLVSDKGIRGWVIKLLNQEMEVLNKFETSVNKNIKPETTAHYRPAETKKYLKFDDLDLPEPPTDTFVRAGAGVSLASLISWTLNKGLTGLQSFAGIPSSVGGAVYNNIHGGTKLLDQFIYEVKLLSVTGEPRLLSDYGPLEVTTAKHDDLMFAYDSSRLQKTKEIVLEVIFCLAHGDADKARFVRDEWRKRKLRVQPQTNCPGSIFKNLTPAEAEIISAPTVSAGWVLDVGLGLKGTKIGGISVSEKHANFFVNDGMGKAAEVLDLINLCRQKAKEKFHLDLEEEIQIVGEY